MLLYNNVKALRHLELKRNKRFWYFLTACALKPVRGYGRLETVTMEMKELYSLIFQWKLGNVCEQAHAV